jgi:hypothetical protein
VIGRNQGAAQFAHDHIERITRPDPDARLRPLCRRGARPLVAGRADGSVVATNGLLYDLPGGTETVTLDDAHAPLDRIDLIYATLSTDSGEQNESRPYARLRT